MPCGPMQGQGQGHGGPKFAKIADFKLSISSADMQKTNGELWCSKTMSKF